MIENYNINILYNINVLNNKSLLIFNIDSWGHFI